LGINVWPQPFKSVSTGRFFQHLWQMMTKDLDGLGDHHFGLIFTVLSTLISAKLYHQLTAPR
jgi:hypothetical protein